MKAFADLYLALDSSTKTTHKVSVLGEYFANISPEDAAWTIALLCGRRPKRPIASTTLQRWAAECAALPDWLFTECYDAVGDLSETISLLLPPSHESADQGLAWWVEHRLLPLHGMSEEDQRAAVLSSWRQLGPTERFLFNKMMTGGFRVGVSQELVVRGISQAFGIPASVLSHRLMGDWKPSANYFQSLVHPETQAVENLGQPYPFCLAHPIEGEVEQLGDPSEWLAEWKWDGIRAQVIHRGTEVHVWSRGEELITERFPEVAGIALLLPSGTVLDGEIVVWKDGKVSPFADLQKRIGRKVVSARIRAELPIAFIAFDCLESDGEDIRNLALRLRRQRLESMTGLHPSLLVAESFVCSDWAAIAEMRGRASENGTEGLMLKRATSQYQVGRKRGDWWKWKLDPFTVDAVVVYAQRGSGRRASLYSDYTFAVWDDSGKLVPFAKAYSGLSDEEMKMVDAIVRRTTLEKFGPVRTVVPEMVMELSFEGIQRSNRHKSGVAVRFPRITRWRTDKKPEDADKLSDILRLLDR